MTPVQTELHLTDLSSDAIKTVGYYLEPDMEWKNYHGTVKGYIVCNKIEVRAHDILFWSRSLLFSTIGARYRLISIMISSPFFVFLSTVAFSVTFPKIFTGLAALGLSLVLAGVLPKKIQNP